MPQYSVEGDTAEIGCIRIDWKQRRWRIYGAAGDRINSLSIEQLRAMVERDKDNPNAEIWPFALWSRNADGYPQIEFRSLAHLEAEINEDDEAVEEEVQSMLSHGVREAWGPEWDAPQISDLSNPHPKSAVGQGMV